MKYIPKLYLETTVFNFYFAGKEGKKQQDTHMLFEAIEKGKYEAYTSFYTLNEISKDTPYRFRMMKEIIDKFVKNIIYTEKDIKRLAGIYISKGIIPEKHLMDARHIASAVINNLDFLVSYNLGHIVKQKTMIGTGFVNLQNGYRQIGLCTPTEVIEYAKE